MWGIPEIKAYLDKNNRITPTHVGNTNKEGRKAILNEDHPHACGEYTDNCYYIDDIEGSPPRMWGIH